MHKTCWYTTVHPLRVGALIGSRGAADLRPMVRFGFHLGAAFQIQDDLLNLVGTEREYGKEIDGDLYEGKRTLPLIHLLRSARGADRHTLDRYLRLERSERTAGDGRRDPGPARRLREHRRSRRRTRGASPEPRSTPSRRRSRRPRPARTGTSSRALVPYMLDRRA